MIALRRLPNSVTANIISKFNSNNPKLTMGITNISSLKIQSTPEEKLNVNVHGETLKFPFVWLRENCQCDQCFHTTAKSRIVDWTRFNVNVQPLNITENNNNIKIVWDDNHTSQFDYDWLKFRSFKEDDQKKYKEEYYKPQQVIWNGDGFNDIFKKHDYNEVLNSDKAMHDCLLNVSVYGVALIENAPERENAVDDVTEKICFTRRTHYGVRFTVQHVPNTSNVAYLSSTLQMHTDLPYYDFCPGVNILHCLVQTESGGGENMLTDGHFVAKYMKEHHPDDYKLLTETEVEWSDVGSEHGNEFYKLHREPVICLGKDGKVHRIKFSIPQRGSRFLGNIDDVKPWYLAHRLFLDLTHKFAAKFKTKAGQMLIFDNARLLHGRNAYHDTVGNVRKVIGACFDWDEVYSRWRCLKAKIEGRSPTS